MPDESPRHSIVSSNAQRGRRMHSSDGELHPQAVESSGSILLRKRHRTRTLWGNGSESVRIPLISGDTSFYVYCNESGLKIRCLLGNCLSAYEDVNVCMRVNKVDQARVICRILCIKMCC